MNNALYRKSKSGLQSYPVREEFATITFLMVDRLSRSTNHLSNISREETLQRRLAEMQEVGRIFAKGEARATRYYARTPENAALCCGSIASVIAPTIASVIAPTIAPKLGYFYVMTECLRDFWRNYSFWRDFDR